MLSCFPSFHPFSKFEIEAAPRENQIVSLKKEREERRRRARCVIATISIASITGFGSTRTRALLHSCLFHYFIHLSFGCGNPGNIVLTSSTITMIRLSTFALLVLTTKAATTVQEENLSIELMSRFKRWTEEFSKEYQTHEERMHRLKTWLENDSE